MQGTVAGMTSIGGGIQISEGVLAQVASRLQTVSDGVKVVQPDAGVFGRGVLGVAAEGCGRRLRAAVTGMSDSVSDAGSGARSTQEEFSSLDRSLSVKAGWRR